MKENLKVSTAFLLIFLISSCSSFSFYKVPVTQGNIFEEEDIEKLQVGQSMDQVQFILGSPMIKDPFHSNRWDYLNLITVGDEKIVEKKAPKEAVTIIAAPVEEVAVPIEELGIVYFDYDKSNIKPEFTSIIQSNFEWLINNPEIRVQLEGHCDERGTNEYNLALGERRARSVLNYLLRLGASPEQFSIVSFGEERPVALGQNETAWQKNRRVEFTRL